MLNLKKVPFAGWSNCLQLSNESVEIIITTDVGPRILHFGWKGQNDRLLYVDPKTEGKTGGGDFKLYGGHRFWHGPEEKPRTYAPDNSTVAHEWDDQILRLVPGVEELTGLQKVVEIRLHESLPCVTISHQLVNHGLWEVTAAPWALTVLAPGGTAIIPQEPFVPFPDVLLPARPLVLWPYTDMSDPRFQWKSRYVALTQDPSRRKQLKFGVRNSVGWGCYVLGENAFIKKAVLQPDTQYPDFGCNWEVFADSHFLELETLGALGPMKPGATVEHNEEWSLAKIDREMPLDELYQHLQDLNAVTA